MTLKRRHSGNSHKDTEINILFDGLDLFNYKLVYSYNELDGIFPTYISTLYDTDILQLYTHNDITYLYTLTGCYMIIPQTNSDDGCHLTLQFNNIHEFEIQNTADIPIAEYTYNLEFNCDACLIYNVVADINISIYYVLNFQLLNNEKINGYIIDTYSLKTQINIFKNDINIRKLIYSFAVLPAQYPHIIYCGFAMASKNNNYSILADKDNENIKYPKLTQYDINLIRKRYENDNIIHYLERYDDEIDGNIISSNEDLILHYLYTITGFAELDEIIKTVSLLFINGDIDKNTYIDTICEEISLSSIYSDYLEYCENLINRIKNNDYLDYVLYPGYFSNFDGVDTDMTRSIDFAEKYYANKGFAPETEKNIYPLHAMILSYDWQDDVLPQLTPGSLFIRYGYQFGLENFELNNIFDGEIQINYGDNLSDFDENNYNHGLELYINDFIFYN